MFSLASQIYSFSVFYEFLIVIKTISGGEIDKLFGTNRKNLIKMFLFFCSSQNWCKKLRITIARCFTGNRNLKLVFTKLGITRSLETKTGQETSVRLLFWFAYSETLACLLFGQISICATISINNYTWWFVYSEPAAIVLDVSLYKSDQNDHVYIWRWVVWLFII